MPGDKSITHRAVMFGALAKGESRIKTNALGRDNFATIRIFKQLGVSISLQLSSSMMKIALSEGFSKEDGLSDSGSEVCIITIHGLGPLGLQKSEAPLDCGNSGTTARLLCGILASTDFTSTLVGDHSLSKRPFARISNPLSEMGVGFNGDSLPLTVSGARSLSDETSNVAADLKGGGVRSADFKLKKASAQVKSAIALAGLYAPGLTTVTEPILSRDHTERMLLSMGAPLVSEQISDGHYRLSINGDPELELLPLDIEVPGDISAAMFFIVAGLISKGDKSQEICIRNVGINPTRSACLDILKQMGGALEITNERQVGGEPVADIFVRPSSLKGISLNEAEVAKAIDEVPILCVAACFAEGCTEIRGADELRVKESDRISMTLAMLSSFGVKDFEELPDGMRIQGGRFSDLSSARAVDSESLQVEEWRTCGDHRISMSAAILEFTLRNESTIVDYGAVETSFPTFKECFE